MALIKKFRTRPVEGLKITALIAFIFAFLWFAAPTWSSFWAGLPLVLLGTWIRSWAAGHLKRNKELATSGPYAYVRDPLYLGRFFLLCGFAVMAAAPITWLLFAIGLLVFFLNYMPRKLRKETARLEKHFGQAYVDYKNAVRSLVPRLRPWPKSAQDRWNARVYFTENREHWLILAVALFLAFMIIKILHPDLFH